MEAVSAHPYPVVAAINGHALGGGLELAVRCDLRICASGGKLGMPPARLGLIYGHTGLQRFIDVIGVAATKELFLVGRSMEASHAGAIGLVNRVVDPTLLPDDSLDLAAEIAQGAPLAARGNKRAIETLARNPVLSAEQERELVELRRSCFTSEDLREGIAAFAEKRKPRWQGR
jgi:enoyl-CoA hydratase/carnithine racemase